MHSLVMLIATWNQSPVRASAPRVAACPGRVWSGAGHPRPRPWPVLRRPVGSVGTSQMCQVRVTHEEDSTRKPSIPHPRGAPDS
jgi:hypothetical protein